MKAPSEAERKLLDLINADREKKKAPALAWDALLSAVAREHSQDMADHDYVDYFSPRLGSIGYRLHRAGASAPNSRNVVFMGSSLEEVLTSMNGEVRPFHQKPATQMGVGVATKGLLRKQYYVTLITVEKHSVIEPFPTAPILNEGYWLKGRIDEGYAKPQLVITLPNGTVNQSALTLDENHRFETIFRFNQGRGKYIVEIMAEGDMGPVILELMRCYAGVPYPEPDKAPTTVEPTTSLHRAERRMAELVHHARLEVNRNLPKLNYDEALATVARGHSKDMVDNNFFAHVSPTTGTLMDRIQAAGIKVRSAAENLATNTDIEGGLRGLMNSPGHRKNILDPDMDRIGVGIVTDIKGRLTMTLIFAQSFLSYDTKTLEEEFIAEANRLRVAKALPQFKVNTKLSEIATANSAAMMKDKKHSTDKASALFKAARLPMIVQIAVFQTAEPVKPETIEVIMERRYSEIGVGIVQSESDNGARYLWITVLLGERL